MDRKFTKVIVFENKRIMQIVMSESNSFSSLTFEADWLPEAPSIRVD